MNRDRGGLALLIVVGVLGLLAVLATAFVTMAQLERRASRQRLYATKAALLARSGIEDALARLSAGQDPSLPDTAHVGEDFNDNGLLDPGVETDAQVFQPTVMNGADCPVAQALRPSFFARAPGSADPATRGVDGRQRGYSGALFAESSYSLKVEDESAKINVNGGFLDTLNRDAASGDALPDHRDPDVRVNPADPKDTGLGWNFQLVRILDNLGAQPEVGLPALGMDAIANRPPGGYASIRDLQQRIGTTKDLSPWLTVSSWIDFKVVHPNGYGLGARGLTYSDIKLMRVPLSLEKGGRPPVNLNAAPGPVLAALLQDLEGTSWHDVASGTPTRIPGPMARDIADALISFRQGQDPDGIFLPAGLTPGPFDSWNLFLAFCDALVPAVINGMNAGRDGGGNLCGADLLKANFNPNTQLCKELPDPLMWRWIDKSDLAVWSTEGSLGPTGTFRVSCVGRVLGPDGRLLAQAEVSSTLEAFSLLRQTTQQDFVAGRTPDGTPSSYLSLANPSPPVPIPPQRTLGASASWNPEGGGQGLAVATTPCAPSALPGKAADFDGAIALATVELDPDGILFLHHFDDGWDARTGSPGARQPGPGRNPCDEFLQADKGESTWPAGSLRPATLYPDGMHAQAGRVPVFQASGNFPPSYVSGDTPSNHGVMAYWVKSMPRDRECIHMACQRDAPGANTQVLAIGRYADQWGLIVENCAVNEDVEYERRFNVDFPPARLLPGLRWRFVTGFFDTDETVPGEDLFLAVRGVAGRGLADPNGGWYGTPLTVTSGEDLCQPGVRFALGGGAGFSGGYGVNQVIDEFAICDFGDTPLGDEGSLLLSDQWARNRYEDGRYYKGGDGRFLSGLLEPRPGGAIRLLRADWTGYRPAEPRLEIPNGGRLPDTGQPRLIDPVLADDPVTGPRAWLELELLDETGTLTLQPLSQGGRLQWVLASFRYRVRFRTALADPLDDPLLETPFFDDITFAWQSMTGPRTLAWGGSE